MHIIIVIFTLHQRTRWNYQYLSLKNLIPDATLNSQWSPGERHSGHLHGCHGNAASPAGETLSRHLHSSGRRLRARQTGSGPGSDRFPQQFPGQQIPGDTYSVQGDTTVTK